MSTEDDIDRFIEEQKRKLARERKDLQNANPNQVTSQPATNGIYRNGDTSIKEIRPPKSGDASLPIGSNNIIRDKLQKERREEYNKFREEKKSRSSMKKSTIEGDGLSLPIGERNSAKDRARIQRNKEYNEFLKQQGGQKRRSRESSLERQLPVGGGPVVNGGVQTNGYGPSAQLNGSFDAPRAHREAASQTPVPRGYDDQPPRGPPRKGWGTPQPLDYEDVLRRKREEELRYRRNDDFDYYQPRLKPAHSDPYINRYDDDGRRSSRRDYDDYDRRRVRFSDEVLPPPASLPPRGADYPDRSYRPRPRIDYDEPVQYDWSQSKTGRSRTLTDIERAKPALRQEDSDRPPRAKSATFADDGGALPLGQRDTGSAARKKKEQYRKELEQQMKEAKAAKIREKELDRSPGFPGTSQAPAPQNTSGRQSRNQPQAAPPGSQGVPQGYTPSFASQPQSVRGQQTPGPYGIQSQTPAYGAAPLSQQPPPAQPLGDLGLKDALAKSQPDLLDRPFSLNYPQASQLAPPGVNSTDPYMYYGMRNPMEADPNPGMMPGLPHPTAATATTIVPSSSALASPLMERYLLLQQQQQQLLQQQQQIAQQTHQLEQQLPAADPRQLTRTLNQPSVTKQTAAQLRGESSIKNFVGDSQLSPRSQAAGASYREQLILQMKEKEAKKLVQNAETAAYEARKEKEIEVYDPWGKGGAGAPMRDKQGKIVADLKKLHDRNETLLNDPRRQDLQLYAKTAGGAPLPAGGLPPGQEVSPLLAAAAAASAGPETGAGAGVGLGPAAGPAFGRIKGSITGGESNPASDPSRNEYQEALRLQVEAKKRREAEEKEKIRQEEEREEKRLEAQRLRIKAEYEKDVERKKQKEEAQRKQKEDLERQLEEKRKEADSKKKESNEQKRKEAEESLRHRDLNHNVNSLNQRVESPPIPTLRTKEPERAASPPIPTLRKADKGGERSEEPNRKDDDYRTVSGASSPPVPAVTTKERGGPKDDEHVMGALSAMRMQLAHEQQRIQSQLDKHRDYDPYNPMPRAAAAPRRASPQVDVFELARHKGTVAVLRNTSHQAAEDFDGLKNRSGSRSRQQLKDSFPNKPDSDITLEAQQRALLRAQQEKLEEMRKALEYSQIGKKNTTTNMPSLRDLGRGSPAIPLDSDSAFIGIDSGETHVPRTPSLPTRSSAVPSPVNSQPRKSGRSVSALDNDDLDMIIAKSKARSDAIGTLHESNDDPDDILSKFLAKKSYDSRPPSGKSDDLSLWLKPSLSTNP